MRRVRRGGMRLHSQYFSKCLPVGLSRAPEPLPNRALVETEGGAFLLAMDTNAACAYLAPSFSRSSPQSSCSSPQGQAELGQNCSQEFKVPGVVSIGHLLVCLPSACLMNPLWLNHDSLGYYWSVKAKMMGCPCGVLREHCERSEAISCEERGARLPRRSAPRNDPSKEG
jgi:hypothetical protein